MIKDVLHVKAPGNWINDPNGFIYYNGQYHLFYQYFPYAPMWGTMHWGHAVSEDLIRWEHLDVALFPTKSYDRNGVFSGSALEKDGDLYLYYSAVRYLEENEENIHITFNGQMETSQALLISEDGIHFDNWKEKQQIIPVCRDEKIADATDTRDPKVWKEKDGYYMVLGSTYRKQFGRVLFYRSQDAVHWQYVNQHRFDGWGDTMECPDLFQINQDYVFLGSCMKLMEEEGLQADHSICTLADFQTENCELQVSEKYQFVDYGLDLYAPQTNLDAKGRRVMIAWIRMPKPVERDGEKPWIGIMCAPRVVEVEHGHIYFRPHENVKALFTERIDSPKEAVSGKYRIRTELKNGEVLDVGGYRILKAADHVYADRTKVFPENSNQRLRFETPVIEDGDQLDIYVDENLIEVYVNDGEYVISNAVYGLKPEIQLSDAGKMELYTLNSKDSDMKNDD